MIQSSYVLPVFFSIAARTLRLYWMLGCGLYREAADFLVLAIVRSSAKR